MDGLDSAKCQKSRRRDAYGIMRMFNGEETKDEQCSSPSKRPKKRKKRCSSGKKRGLISTQKVLF